MKKKDIILISIIIILILPIIGIILFYNIKEKSLNKESTIEAKVLATSDNYLLVTTDKEQDYVISTKDLNYKIGDTLKLELKDINEDKTPISATAKKITVLKESKNSIEDSNQNEVTTNQSSKTDAYNETDIINYFESLNTELTKTNKGNLSETIKEKFVKCIDFIFYNQEINGTTFKELTNEGKLKVLELTLSIDSKIETKFPYYKETISSSYQNIKNKIVEVYLKTTTDICNKEPELCTTAKEGFQVLKENFGITWKLIKELTNKGTLKLKDLYEIWKYN